jgi:hypothetical protein
MITKREIMMEEKTKKNKESKENEKEIRKRK